MKEMRGRHQVLAFFRSLLTATWRGIRKIGRWAREDRGTLVVLLGVLVYSGVWSFLTISRFYALHATVADLGDEMEGFWLFLHPGGAPASAYLLLAVEWPLYFLLSPLAAPESYPLLLVFQSLALGSGAIPLYVVARHHVRDRGPSLLLSLSYLIYFPLAGANWFDAHTEVLFIPLFLFGYAFYLKRWNRAAFLCLLLSGLTYFPYEAFVVLFSVLVSGKMVAHRHLTGEPWDHPRLRLVGALAAISAFFLAAHYVFLTEWGGSQEIATFLHQGSVPIPAGSVALTLALVLAPMLFLPLLSPRWLLFLTPYVALALTAGCGCYVFPYLFQLQYTALFVPFVFLGTIEGVALVTRGRGNPRTATPAPTPVLSRFGRSHPRRAGRHLTITILVATALMATVFEPYGPFNVAPGESFGLPGSIAINWTSYQQMQDVENLVPRSDPYVLMQNDMPGLLPRPPGEEPLVSDFPIWRNCTVYDAVHDSFPLLAGASRVETPIDYAVTDPTSSWFLSPDPAVPGISMYCFSQALYRSGQYGILAEEHGRLLLQRGYRERPRLYAPFTQTYPATTLRSWGGGGTSADAPISRSNVRDVVVWYGPYVNLPPGTYEARFQLESSDLSPTNRLTLYCTADNGITNLCGHGAAVTGANFTAPDASTWVDLHLSLNDTYANVEFPGFAESWNGTISVESLQVLQTAPGSPTFP